MKVFVRSKADPSIIGMVLPKRIHGWNAVKLTMSVEPYKGESQVGSMFNCTEQCWQKVMPDDYQTLAKASKAFLAWFKSGQPLHEI